MKNFVHKCTGSCVLTLSLTSTAFAQSCQIDDLQSCRSCPEIEHVLDLKKPDAGEYYRGAYWNGLYAAFRWNCRELGKQLLQSGANPNLGGSSGSFLVSLVSSWPHRNPAINQEWLKMIGKYSIDVDWKNPYTGESARELVSSGDAVIEYPQIWARLIESSPKKGGTP